MTELGLRPSERVEREGVAAWDLTLDGRRRRGVRITLILDPAVALVAWVHYAPPLTDSVRKVYRQLLRWNDELPLVKFALAEDDRPVLSAEVAVGQLERDTVGLTVARLLAVCDLLYPESAEWVERIERSRLRLNRRQPIPPPSEPADPAGERLLERHAASLGELLVRGGEAESSDEKAAVAQPLADAPPAGADVVRTAARLVLLDAADRVLLLAAREPVSRRLFWILPGGGVEADETLEQAAARELLEELPMAGAVALRGPVWRQRLVFSWNGKRVEQTEWLFVGRLEHELDAAAVRLSGPEEAYFEGARWATVAELDAWPEDEILAPRALAGLLQRLLAGDWPTQPIDAGL